MLPEWKKEPKLTKTNCCWSGNKLHPAKNEWSKSKPRMKANTAEVICLNELGIKPRKDCCWSKQLAGNGLVEWMTN